MYCIGIFAFKQKEETAHHIAQEVQLQQEILQLQQQLLIDEAIFTGQSIRARNYIHVMDSIEGQTTIQKRIRLAFLDQLQADSIAQQKKLRQLHLQRELQLQKLKTEHARIDEAYFVEKNELTLKIRQAEKAYSKLLDSVVLLNTVIERERNGHQQLSFMNKTNRVYYVGEVKDSMANGNGSGIWQTGGIYNGQWKNNVRHGYGKYRWVDGERYEGEYVADRRHGQGTYYWLNGDVYTGEWQEDRRNGYGELRNSDGKIVSKGKWKDDQLVLNELVN